MQFSDKIEHLKSKYEGIQLEKKELGLIIEAIENVINCNLLVFGLGNDTGMWMEINKNGRTAFIEDHKAWFENITAKFPASEAYHVTYPNNITQWRETIDVPEKLELELPMQITTTEWDIILVDAPAGWQMIESHPGRMSSIYMAKKLIKKGGIIFVHDCEREVEDAYTHRYLKEENLVTSVFGRALLKMYRG